MPVAELAREQVLDLQRLEADDFYALQVDQSSTNSNTCCTGCCGGTARLRLWQELSWNEGDFLQFEPALS